jgi:hypothetical protein
VETFVSGVASDSPPITVSDTHIFIADKWRIKKVPLSGGPAETVAAADFYVSNLVTDGAYVYWVEAPFSAVCKVPVGGGDVTSLASGEGPPGPIRLQNGTVFWMDHFDTIRAVPAVGGAVRIVASGLPFLSDFVVDGTNIYFSENDTGDIKKIPVGGGAATTLANGLHGSYNNLAVDGANLYWINQNHIGKVPTTGGTPSFVLYVLASDPFFPASIVLDGTSVYWTEPPIREIWKAQK